MTQLLCTIKMTKTDNSELRVGEFVLDVASDPSFSSSDYQRVAMKHVRDNADQFGYEIDRSNGIVYFGATSLKLEDFQALTVEINQINYATA